MIELMVMVYIIIKMGLNIKATGIMISKKVLVVKNGKMEPFMKVTSLRVANMDLEPIYGVMAVPILVTGTTIIFTERGNTFGQMDGFMMVNGGIINFMERATIHGLMEENTKELISRTKKRDSVFIIGPMGSVMREIGKMGNSMEKVKSLITEGKVGKESGKTEIAYNG